jgi:hypothetical protein
MCNELALPDLRYRTKETHKRQLPGCVVLWTASVCLVVRVLGYRFGGPGSIPGITRKKK